MQPVSRLGTFFGAERDQFSLLKRVVRDYPDAADRDSEDKAFDVKAGSSGELKQVGRIPVQQDSQRD